MVQIQYKQLPFRFFFAWVLNLLFCSEMILSCALIPYCIVCFKFVTCHGSSFPVGPNSPPIVSAHWNKRLANKAQNIA